MELTLELTSYAGGTSKHSHSFHQLVLPLEGTMDMELSGVEGRVDDRRIAVVPAGASHEYSVQGDNRFVVVNIAPDLAPSLSTLPPFITLDSGLSHFLLFLEEEVRRHPGEGDGLARHADRQLVLLLTRLLVERFGRPLKLDRRVEAARRYLDEHLDRTVTLDEVAAVSCLSQRQLTELFRRYFEMSPGEYLSEQRMQLAWQLLREPGASVQRVAERCGYRSLAAFSSRFARHFGVSPSHLRQKAPDR